MSIPENEWFIQVPWGRICVMAWGSCLDPPVLLCHGSLDSAVSFRPLVNLLPRNFYYIGLELPGNGKSDWLPQGMMISVYDLVYVIDAVVRHFRWESFSLIAHSMGAILAKLYNVSCPNKISKLVELDPINYVAVPPDQFRKWYDACFTTFYENYDKYNFPKERAPTHTRAKAIETLKRVRGLTHETAIAVLDRCSAPAPNGLIRYTFDPRYKVLLNGPSFSAEHIKNIFTTLNTPTLAVISQQSLDKGLFRNTKFLIEEESYPNNNLRRVVVDGNHDVHVIRPELVAPSIARFLLNGLEGIDAKSKL